MFPKSIDAVSCSSSIILDDIINGNVTTDGQSFFLGLTQLDSQLANLDGNLTTINSSMTNLKSSSANITTVHTAGTNALTNIAKIPNNVGLSDDPKLQRALERWLPMRGDTEPEERGEIAPEPRGDLPRAVTKLPEVARLIKM